MTLRLPRRLTLAGAIALLAFAIVAAVTVAARGLVRDAITRELVANGFESATFEVVQIGPWGLRLKDVALASDLRIDEVAIDVWPLEGRLGAVTVRGAQLAVSLEEHAFAESTPARLLAGQDGTPGSTLPPIRIERSTLVVLGEEPIRIGVEGEMHVEGDGVRARLDVDSPVGRHVLTLRRRESGDIVIAGHGGGDALNARVRLRPDGSAGIRAHVTLARGTRSWRGHRLTTDGARFIGSATLVGDRVDALDVHAEASSVVLDELSLGDAVLRATAEPSRIVWDARMRGKDGLEARAGGALSPVLSEWSFAFAWELTGPLDGRLVEHAAPFIALEGSPQLVLSGHARRQASAWHLDAIRGSVTVGALHVPDAELVLERVAMQLVARATIEAGRTSVEIESGSRLRAARTQLDALGLDALDAALALDVVHDDARGLRVDARAPIDARMARLTVGDGDGALGFEDVTMVLASRRGEPIATSFGPRTTLVGTLDATAPRLVGLFGGGRTDARGEIEVTIDGDETRISLPLHVEAARITEAESEVSLDEAVLKLPLEWQDGEVSADGRMRARRMSWRAIPVGATAGAVRLADDAIRLAWQGPATRDADFALAARILIDGASAGTVRVSVPRTVVRTGDPLQRVLAELTDMRVEGAMEGDLRLDLDAPERGDARLVFHDARVREVDGAGGAEGVRGTMRFTNLSPLATASPAPVTWTELEIGGVKLEHGAAYLGFAPPGDVIVDGMKVALAGGIVDVAPFRFDWDEPDIALDLAVRGVDLERVLDEMTSGHVAGDGKLDGRVALRLKLGARRRIVLGDGHLASRGPGTLRVRTGSANTAASIGVSALVDGSFLHRRVLAAIEDFEYRRLSLDVVGQGTRHVRARVVGRGKRMPQELDVTLNFRGVQPLLDHALRLWPSGAKVRIEVGS